MFCIFRARWDGSLFSAKGPTATINRLELESAVTEAGRSMHAATGAHIDFRSIQVKETIWSASQRAWPQLWVSVQACRRWGRSLTRTKSTSSRGRHCWGRTVPCNGQVRIFTRVVQEVQFHSSGRTAGPRCTELCGKPGVPVPAGRPSNKIISLVIQGNTLWGDRSLVLFWWSSYTFSFFLVLGWLPSPIFMSYVRFREGIVLFTKYVY